MLGGAGMNEILSKGTFLSRLNKYFISKFAAVIVEGELNFHLFSKIISKEKVYIIPNFADDYLFVKDEEIKFKFDNLDTINLLFLSNLIPGKGYKELAKAYAELSEPFKSRIFINFVGGFETLESKHEFLSQIKTFNNMKYLGEFIDGHPKRELYNKSHILCLPTYYPFEGQPISILEAYASGCVVITTQHSGIPFIFSDSINGYLVEKKSVSSLKKVLEKVVFHKLELSKVAINNRDQANEFYRSSIFRNKILNVFLTSYKNEPNE
jgi:glycosyltransferase involved in cell wall biosynthesis